MTARKDGPDLRYVTPRFTWKIAQSSEPHELRARVSLVLADGDEGRRASCTFMDARTVLTTRSNSIGP